MTNAVLVDDTDPNVAYTGTWLPVSNYGDVGNFGQPLLNTFHNALSSNTSLTYNFTGYGIEIYGINQPDSATTAPPISCLVDGESYPSVSSGTNSIVCQAAQLSNGSHMLEVIVPSPLQRPFLFDFVKYYPSSAITPGDHATVSIDFAEQQSLPRAYNGSGWDEVIINGTSSLIASGPNASFELEFNGNSYSQGTSLTWFGLYDEQYPPAPTTATYSVDGQTPVSFPLKGVSSGSLFNQTLFQTTQLSDVLHRIVVNYQGNNNTTPLSITSLVIWNGTLPEPSQLPSSAAPNSTNNATTTTASLPTTSSRTTQSNVSITGRKIGLIGGGTLIAVFVGVCITIAATYLWRRRHRKSTQNEDSDIQAFSTPPSASLPTFTWLQRRKDLEREGAGRLVESDSSSENSTARMIPPRKMMQVAPQSPSSLQSPTLSSPISTNTRVISRVVDIQEEDSGVRISQMPEGNSGTVTRLLPPVYTEL